MEILEKTIQNFDRVLGILGLGILGWMIYSLGPEQIAKNIHAVSWGFFLMVLFKSFRYLFQTISWKLILAEERKKVSFWRLFVINLEGESLNYITITRVGGDPLKVWALRENVSLAQSAASVIVLKFCIIFSFWLAIAGGFLITLFNVDVTGEIKIGLARGLGVLTLFVILLSLLQRTGVFGGVSWLLKQFQSKRAWLSQQALRLARLDQEILMTYRLRSGRIFASVMLSLIAWIEEFFFIWLALRFLGIPEDWFVATVIGTLSLMMNSFFFFVPWRAGTQEGTLVLTFTLLGLSEPVGLSLAILRRMRELFWVFLGLALFAIETTSSVPPAEKMNSTQ